MSRTANSRVAPYVEPVGSLIAVDEPRWPPLLNELGGRDDISTSFVPMPRSADMRGHRQEPAR
jgi:hypothetical protein